MDKIQDLIAKAEGEVRGAEQRRDAAQSRSQTILDLAKAEARENLTTAETTLFNGAVAERDAANKELDAAAGRLSELRELAADMKRDAEDGEKRDATDSKLPYDKVVRQGNTREPHVYSRESAREGVSFFRDALGAQGSNFAARERIERSQREAEVDGRTQQRATTTSSYAGLVVPQYLTDDAANVLRLGRPFANLATARELPAQGDTFQLPRATTGVSAAIQATQNATLSTTDQVWANVTLPVATVGGYAPISRQSLDRGIPGLDQIIWSDLQAAYHEQVDKQAVLGTGSSGQVLGASVTGSIITHTAFGAAATITSFYSKLAGVIASQAAAGAQVQPKIIVMHPRRWGWLTAAVDTAGRPLTVPDANGKFNALAVNIAPGTYSADGDPTSPRIVNTVGNLQGLPVVTDANIPITLGGGSLEDIVLVIDPSKHLLFEDGDGTPTMIRFDQTLSTQMSIVFEAFGYIAYTAGRYPAATGKVGGIEGTSGFGLTTPTF